MTRPTTSGNRTGVAAITVDSAFEHTIRTTFGASSTIDLRIASGSVAECSDSIDVAGMSVVLVDIEGGREDEIQALERLTQRIGAWPPVVVVTPVFDAVLARRLLQMRVADFLVKPVPPAELVRACARVASCRRGRRRGADLHLPARGRRRRRHHARDPDRHAAARQRAARRAAPVWSISIFSTAPAPTISTSSRASTSRKSSRARSGSTANCSR
jgi:DNA-binding NarL/FixJ family response regulator